MATCAALGVLVADYDKQCWLCSRRRLLSGWCNCVSDNIGERLIERWTLNGACWSRLWPTTSSSTVKVASYDVFIQCVLCVLNIVNLTFIPERVVLAYFMVWLLITCERSTSPFVTASIQMAFKFLLNLKGKQAPLSFLLRDVFEVVMLKPYPVTEVSKVVSLNKQA